MEISEKVDLILSKCKPISLSDDMQYQISEVCYTLDEYYGFVNKQTFLRCVELYNMLCDGGYSEDMRL